MPEPLPLAYLNGGFLPLAEARVSPLDRGFLFGDGVYEVIPVFGGRLFRLHEHLDRLDRSLREIRMEPVHDRPQWLAILGRLARDNGGGDQALYVQVTRGGEFGRSHVPTRALAPTVFAFTQALAPAATPDPGLHCVTAPDIRWARCDIKSTSLLGAVLLKWQAFDAGATEAILLADGWLREGSSSTVHVVRQGRLLTPPNSNWILPGTTRDVVVELAARAGIATEVRPVSEADLRSADEVLVGAATMRIRPVVRLDDQPVGNGQPGPVARRLRELFDASTREFGTECAP